MSDIDRVLRSLYNRIQTAVGRGRVRAVDDTGPVQMHQVDFGPLDPSGRSLQVRDKTPVHYSFGFTANPPLGADVITSSLGGDQNKTVVVGSNHQTYRLKNLNPGDAAVYDQRGAYVWLQPGGIVIDAAGGNVTIQNADNITSTNTGNLSATVGGDFEVIGSGKGTLTAPSGLTINANTKLVGTLEVTEQITADAGITATDDVTAGSISLIHHDHTVTGVAAGSATVTTSPPV